MAGKTKEKKRTEKRKGWEGIGGKRGRINEEKKKREEGEAGRTMAGWRETERRKGEGNEEKQKHERMNKGG